MASGGPVKLEVTLETGPARAALASLRDEFRTTAGAVKGALGGVVGSIGQDLRSQLGNAVQVAARTLMQATGANAISDPLLARVSAQQRTVQALGMGAAGMDPQAIRSVMAGFKQIEDLQLSGRREIEKATAGDVMSAGEAAGLAAAIVALDKTMGSILNILPGAGAGR